MRKTFLVAGVAALAVGTTGVAFAQTPEPSIEATASASPSKAGTKSKPKAVTFNLAVKNNPASCLFDPSGTQTTADGGVKVRGWFDNEWGFSNRLLDLARLVGERAPVTSRRVSWSIA